MPKLSLVERDNEELLFTGSIATRICKEPYYPHLDTDFLWHWYIAALQIKTLKNTVTSKKI